MTGLPPRDLAIDYRGQVDGPCPLCGNDNESFATFAFALTDRSRLCGDCVEAHVPQSMYDALEALEDLDTAIAFGEPFRRSILEIASQAITWMADEYASGGGS